MRDPNFRETISHIAAMFRCRFRTASSVSDDEVAHAFGVLKTNSVGLSGLDARALYPTVSLLSHSCAAANLDPLVQSGSKFGFRAQRRIGKGEELTIRYCPILEHRLVVRRTLREQWMFDCGCERCGDPGDVCFLSSPRCGECGKGVFVPLEPRDDAGAWKCGHCGATATAEEILRRDRIGRQAAEKAISLHEIVSAIKLLEGDFHPNYHVIVSLKIRAAVRTGSSADTGGLDAGTRAKFCRGVLSVLGRLDRGDTKLSRQLTATFIKARLECQKNNAEKR